MENRENYSLIKSNRLECANIRNKFYIVLSINRCYNNCTKFRIEIIFSLACMLPSVFCFADIKHLAMLYILSYKNPIAFVEFYKTQWHV